MYEYFARYAGLRDADTPFLIVDAGFGLDIRKHPYRLMRINAWEMKIIDPATGKKTLANPLGELAKSAVDALFLGARVITTQTFKNKTASGDPELTFDRWLAEVWIDGVNLSDWIVAQGHGKYQAY